MHCVLTALFVAFCVCVSHGHNGPSKSEQFRRLPKSRSFFADCCLGRKLLCKSPPVPWVRDWRHGPRLLQESQVCDGRTDCPLGEDERCIKCGDPPLVASGFRTENQTFYPAGTVVAYACQSGFVMRDGPTVTCDGRGNWSKAPVCDRQCSLLIPQVPNGMIDPFIGPLLPGAVVTFSCAQGYSPMRNNFLRCDSGGAWIGTPVCVRVCPVSLLPVVGNASRPEVTDPLPVGTVVPYICIRGNMPSPRSNMSFTCNGLGEWTGSATCLPATRKLLVCEGAKVTISCPVPLSINVESANYGRTQDASVCPHPQILNQTCVSLTSLPTLSTNCNSKPNCIIDVTNTFFGGDPCVGTYKYLEMEYTCN